ncbi:MAG: aminoglycoside phosphotransferase family protein [Ilumatobacteraceae bacterium]|nr:aminoglycoside phosphotransferase family protein [Ilumatobacteraceae bacterium]
MATPAAELEIDEALVRSLLVDQQPDLADLPMRTVANGWDNVVVQLGTDLMVRLPRRQASVQLVLNEQRWLPELAPKLPLPIPSPIFAGKPGAKYPWAWSICPWLPGDAASDAPPADPHDAALSLAAFVVALHQPAPADAPENPFRGVHLRQRAEAVQIRAESLGDVVPTGRVLAVWDDLRSTQEWAGPALWLHGDLHPSNMLTLHGRLSAVIDFGDITSGDPATDLALAWMMFEPRERDVFRMAAAIDDETWRRAAGWALNLSLAYLTGDDTTSMPSIGRTTLAAVLAEFG